MRIKQWATIVLMAPFTFVGLVVVLFQSGHRAADTWFYKWLDHIT